MRKRSSALSCMLFLAFCSWAFPVHSTILPDPSLPSPYSLGSSDINADLIYSLCSENNTIPWVTWCNYNSPTIIPLPFNVSGTTFDFLSTTCSNNSNIYSSCLIVDNIAAIDIAGNLILYFSTTNGAVYHFELGSGNELQKLESYPSSKISNFDTYVVPDNQNATFLAYGYETAMRLTYIDVYGPLIMEWNVTGTVLHTFVQPVPILSNNTFDALVFVITVRKGDSDYFIDFTLAKDGDWEDLGTWRIVNSANSALQFDVTPFYANFTTNSEDTPASSLVLLVRNGTSANIFMLNISTSLDGDIYLGPTSKNVTTFYALTNANYQHVDYACLWAEPGPRFNGADYYPYSLLWVIFGSTSYNVSSLHMVAFTEYETGQFTNATNKERPSYSFFLPETVSTIEHRYIPKYENVQIGYLDMNETSILNVHHTEVFIAMQRSMMVVAVQIYEDTQSNLLIDQMNDLPFAGEFVSVFISENAQHIIAATDRMNWEMLGMERFYNICEALANPDTDPNELQFLQPYASQCAQGYRMPNIMDFTQYAGVCPLPVQCPSFNDLVVSEVPKGFYTQYTFSVESCTPGTFCVSGIQQSCPKGFTCPEYGMSIPSRCPFNPYYNSTCYGDGLIEPQPCTEGMSCPTPYFPPFPSPPGYCANDAQLTSFTACKEGDYCSLGMACNSSYRECPLGTFCTEPDVLTPTICACDFNNNTCSYCEAGSSQQQPCPAGFYCQGPNSSVACSDLYYCPEGTFSAQLCPAGKYCENPAVAEICPRRHFCPEGSMLPKKCAFFSLCPPGSTAEKGNYGSPLFGAIALGFLYLAWRLYLLYRVKYPKKAVKKTEDVIPLLYTPAEEGLQEKSFVIDIDFNKLGLTIGDKRVLSGVTGKICHKRVTAVMGPSGAGKTTFLTTLADKVTAGKVTGSIYINGQKGSLGQYKEIVGFVPQEDIMLRQMTVEENLLFSAQTRLPAGMSDSLRIKQVNAVIDILGLRDVCGSLIGDEVTRGVSGGQRKRVNIGMELVADPTVLFLDEPTSGLDSTSSREVLAALRKIAGLGITIVTVIHQPRYEIFTMFHDVLLLGKGGRTVYLGESSRALEYFEMLGFVCPPLVNPPDFFLDVISGEVERLGHPDFVPQDLFDLWEQNRHKYESAERSKESKLDSDETTEKTNTRWCAPCSGEKLTYRVIPGFFSQFWLFFLRAILQQLRNMPAVVLDMLLVASSGLFLGIIFSNTQYIGPPSQDVCNRLVAPQLIERCLLPLDDPIGTIASLTCLSVALTAVASSLRVFGNERVVYWREASWGLDTLAYFLGKDVAQVPSMLLQPLVFLVVYSTIVATQAPFWDVYLIILIVQFTSVGIGYLVSIMINSSLSQLVGVVFVLVSMMFSGARPTLQELSDMIFPLPIMPNFSFIRWAQEGFYLTEIKLYTKLYNVQTGMDIWSYKFDHYHLDIAMTIVLGVVFRIFALILLYVLDRHKKK